MDPTDGDQSRPEQRGYQGYRSRDDRHDRDRSNREQEGGRYGGSSSQGQRNPFSGGGGGGGYDNGGGQGDHRGGNGSRYGGDRGGDRYGGDRGGDRYGGDRGGDRYGGDRGGDRYGGDRGGDRYGGDRSGERYGNGNGNGGRGGYEGYGGDRGGRNRGDNGGGREPNGGGGRRFGNGGGYGGQRPDSSDRRGGSAGSGGTAASSGSSYDAAGPRKRGMDDDGRMECSPMNDRPNKRHQGDAESGPSTSRGPRKERPAANQKREKRDRYEILTTKPNDAPQKQGSSGELIHLKANYFELRQRPNYEMVMYRVDFDPECELPPKRKYLMYTQRELFGAYLYDTRNSVYLTHRLPQDLLTVDTMDRENNPYKMTIKFGTIVSMDTRESLQVLNLILRRSMEGLNLQLIGRNLFDPQGLVSYNNFHIQLWPGYTTSIRQHEDSVLLCAEITSKVMRNENIYDILRQCGRDGDWQERFQDEILGLVVLTDYNNKTYKISDVDFTASPSDTFETKKGPISFIQYYQEKYGITIRNATQPMLITRSTDRQRRGGEEETISLIPELCRPTGLTDQQRNNFQLMKAIADQTRMDPRKRMQALGRFNQRLQNTPASQEILRAWNMDLDRNLIDVQGRKLNNESILYGSGEKEMTGQFSDWQMAFRNKSMFLSYPLKNWVAIVPGKMRHQVQTFMNMMKKASSQMRFQVDDPRVIDVDDRLQSYSKGFEDANSYNPQLIIAFVNNNNADKYASIKKLGCCTYATPTQVVVAKTLNNKSLMSIATKVAIQLNCKLGGTPWLVSIPTKGLMTVGIDVSRDSKDRDVSWGALVASMDLKNVTKESFFSCVSKHTNQNDFTTQLAVDMTRALKAYRDYNGVYPEKIVLYRDGVGDGQLEYVFHTELAEIKSRLEAMYSENNAALKFVFIIVSKKVNTRIFGRDEKNPPSGTVVDSRITLPERQDFYLISQTVRQGTVSPTAYNVIYDSLKLPADRLQQLTYKQCHLYYNWAGTVRVPAVCQCAHKLSFLVAQFLHQEPLAELERKLYFL